MIASYVKRSIAAVSRFYQHFYTQPAYVLQQHRLGLQCVLLPLVVLLLYTALYAPIIALFLERPCSRGTLKNATKSRICSQNTIEENVETGGFDSHSRRDLNWFIVPCVALGTASLDNG
jgi:hypothetical protein